MPNVNKFGLKRSIPEDVKREVRQRSKFGCVVCRAGLYEYEHIVPCFNEAERHEAQNICCLCSSCHDKVTRGHYPKDFIRKKYEEVQASDLDEARPPFSDIVFNNQQAELKIGGIAYDPGITSVVKYHGREVFSIAPADEDGVTGVNATFVDSDGRETLNIEGNVWTGALTAWDTEVVGSRVKVRKRKGVYSLVLRFEAPDRVVVERLDMRMGNSHILVSETTHALGRYDENGEIFWFHSNAVHMGGYLRDAAAIEFLTPLEAEWRDRKWAGMGQRVEGPDGHFVMQTGLGVACKALGIIMGANCLKFGQGVTAFGGPRPLARMRRAVFNRPQSLAKYISSGEW